MVMYPVSHPPFVQLKIGSSSDFRGVILPHSSYLAMGKGYCKRPTDGPPMRTHPHRKEHAR